MRNVWYRLFAFLLIALSSIIMGEDLPKTQPVGDAFKDLPKRRTLPLNLSFEKSSPYQWVATDPSSTQTEKDRITILPKKGSHSLLLNHSIASTFSFSFSEERGVTNPEATIRWWNDGRSLNRTSGFHNHLQLKKDGTVNIKIGDSSLDLADSGAAWKPNDKVDINDDSCYSTTCAHLKQGAFLFRVEQLQAGTYTLKAKAKLSNPNLKGPGILIGAKDYGGPEKQVATDSRDFKDLEISFQLPRNSNALLYVYLPEGSKEGIVDEVELIQVRTGKNVITNGSFESGSFADKLKRTWSIRALKNTTTISLDGKIVLRGENSHFVRPIPLLSIDVDSNESEEKLILSNLKFDGLLPRSSFSILQFPIKRFDSKMTDRLTVIVDDSVRKPDNIDFYRLPDLFQSLESIAGFTLTSDPVVVPWTYSGGGMNERWIYIPDFTAKIHQTPAHEMAHWARCAGGVCDRDKNQWMWEGFADYLGMLGVNNEMGKPTWVFSSYFSLPNTFRLEGLGDPPLGLGKGQVPQMYGGEEARNTASYLKGHMYFVLLSELAGYDAVLQSMRNNHDKSVDANEWIKELERISGKDLQWTKSGWLEKGPYKKYSPLSFNDTDEDGVVDLQESLRGLDPKSADTDGDSLSDYYELVMNHDPKDPENPGKQSQWLIDGVPTDFPREDTITSTSSSKSNEIGRFESFWLKRANCISAPSDSCLAGAVYFDQKATRDRQYNINVIFIRMTDKRLFKISWISRNINELLFISEDQSNLASYVYPIECTNLGCEFEIPTSAFGLSIPEQISFHRGGYNKSVYKDISISAPLDRIFPTN